MRWYGIPPTHPNVACRLTQSVRLLTTIATHGLRSVISSIPKLDIRATSFKSVQFTAMGAESVRYVKARYTKKTEDQDQQGRVLQAAMEAVMSHMRTDPDFRCLIPQQ